MKKFAIAALATLVATVSLSTVAEAGWRRHHGWNGHHHGHYNRFIYRAPRVVVYNDYCFVKKVKHYDDYGNVYVKRVRICG
ncbi:MAG: hypothetical protein JWM58_1115 [Rhizobium sp.]|nr:hypothetical protein [Rhizobium sp.]